MFSYVDNFSYISDSQNNTLRIVFRQTIPEINEKGELVKNEAHEVCSIVMTSTMAKALQATLEDFLGGQSS